MGGKGEGESFYWEEEYNGEQISPPPVSGSKRKTRSKRIKFVGWGSKQLVEFLQSIGQDTNKQITQYDAAEIINKYVKENNLIDSVKKKKIVCDERLYFLFGKKSMSRNKIYDLLEDHYAENHFESDDDWLYSSEEENDLISSEKRKSRTNPFQKMVLETPKSCFAAVISDNIKLVYLRRSLVQDLLKDPETYETKIVGSIVRIKSDPNDYLQKNAHQLLQVTGIKRVSGSDDTSTQILLQASNFVKDIQISTLSDDNFSVEECEDLCQKVKDGQLKRLTIVELEEKARLLHEDITKHWLVRELALLQKLIDRANEKGWRRELFEYLETRKLLQTPAEQERLLNKIPKIIADEVELEATPQDCPDTLEEGKDGPHTLEEGKDGSLIPNLNMASEIRACDIAANGTSLLVSCGIESIGILAALSSSEQLTGTENMPGTSVLELQEQLPEMSSESNAGRHVVEIEENKIAEGLAERQVIELSDDDDEENEALTERQVSDMKGLEWHYADPQGDVQGPFSIGSLKRWSESDYFPPDFKVWKTGESQEKAVLLCDILRQCFPT